MATVSPNIVLQGQSSVSAAATVGTAVCTLVTCKEPAANIYLLNADATATNTIVWILNGVPVVAGPVGIPQPGGADGAGLREIKMVYGDVLTAIAAADRVCYVVAVPSY